MNDGVIIAMNIMAYFKTIPVVKRGDVVERVELIVYDDCTQT